MNPEVQQAINNINAHIVENHNNEITANVLNPILIELANLFDIVGDLSDLNTTDSDSIVDAINWVLNQISTGITIHSGQANPNVTPPAFFAVGDLYSRLDILENPYQIYIYNGAEWAEIRQAINDSVIGLDTTWSSEKISEAIQGDRLENVPTIDLVGNEITISNASWWIQGVNYNLSPDFEDTINYTSVAGMMRKDIIVAVAGNSMLRIQGTESDTNPLEPTVPPNTLLVTSIDVFHDSIGNPEPPIISSEFVKKMGYQSINKTSGSPGTLAYPLAEDKRNYVILNWNAPETIAGFTLSSMFGGDTVYNGMIVTIDNQSAHTPTLLDQTNEDALADVTFDFRAGIEEYTMKPGELLTFKLRNSVLVFVSTNKAEVDVTLEQARQNGNVLEGDVIFDSNDSRSIQNGVGAKIYFGDDGIIGLESFFGTYVSFFELGDELYYSSENPSSKGISGGYEFDKQGDRKAFAQIADLEDALTADNIDYDKTTSGLDATNVQDAVDELVTKITCVQRTGSEIAFDVSAVYGTTSSPCTGNITYDFTDAKFDMVQTMFHEDTTVPTFGVGTVISGEYEVELLNVITFRRLSNSEVLIKIQQITV